MSIALDRSTGSSPSPAPARFQSGGGVSGGCYAIFGMSDVVGKEVGPLQPPPPAAKAAPGEDSCSSSSIGRDSDLSGTGGRSDEGDSGEAEVQSRLKGPLETMDVLEDSLPMRRGISKFYHGKSKSFTSLEDTISSSMKDNGKPEDAYTRKRKNLLAFSVITEELNSNKQSCIESVISDRPAKSSRVMNTSVTSSSSCSNNNTSEEEPDPSCLLPPHHPKGKFISFAPASASSCLSREKSSFSLRSFSLADLHGAASLQSGISTKKHTRKQ